MTKLGKLWTASIAYIALAVGAGLSIMYNIVDTMYVRGPAMDVFDYITAIAAPAIVVLMVELFVSRWWIGRHWTMAIVRWLATIVIGGVAMRTSWTHGHDFMSSRGQAPDVATLWPLAIDLLAVMATALILAGRHAHGRVATDTLAMSKPRLLDTPLDMATALYDSDSRWIGPVATASDVAESEAAFYGRPDVRTPDTDNVQGLGHARWADLVTGDHDDPMATRPAGDLDAWTRGYEEALDAVTAGVGDEAERFLATGTLSARPPFADITPDTDTLPRRTRTPAGSVPAEFLAMAAAWDPARLARADMIRLSAAYFGVSERTARRWLVASIPSPTGRE